MKRNRALPYWIFGGIFLTCGTCASFTLGYAGEKMSSENLANLIMVVAISLLWTISCISSITRCDKEFWNLDHQNKMLQQKQSPLP